MVTSNMELDVKKIIQVHNVGKEFNGVWVLNNIDFDLNQGEIHALVGENGAGKSTFIKILSGVHQPSSGTMMFEGKKVKFESIKQSEKMGIRTVHQEINLISYFSIYENIFVGAEKVKKMINVKVLDNKKMKNQAKEVIKSLGIEFDVNKTADSLNASMKRIVEISKVLVHQPKVIIFDEPTTSLGEEERRNLLSIIKGLKVQGISIIYISHNLEEILDIADRITVFRDGKKIQTMDRKVATVENIISKMIGNQAYTHYRRNSKFCDEKENYLEINNLTTNRLKNISLEVKKGEVLGIAGVVGAGKTEVAKAIFGLDKILRGEIKVNGEKYYPTPQNAIKKNIALVPEERQAEGLIPNYCLSKNISLTYLDKWVKRGIIDRKAEIDTANEFINKLAIKCTGSLQHIKFLSGGNQQKAILSRWLNGSFDIGIFDEPTKGIDIKTKEDIYNLLENLAREGKSIMVLSSYLPELLCLCDRILVMNNGELVGEFDPREEKAEERIMAAMLGGGIYGKVGS